MVTEIDPYRELLQISATERLPDHYALLGLRQFESNAAKIAEAADRRMTSLQEIADGDHLDAAQRLLNEVAVARRCLQSVPEKIAYDEMLRTRQQRVATAVRRARSKRRQVLVGGIAILVVAALLAQMVLRQHSTQSTGNLIVDWPLDQRDGAAIFIDGVSTPITATQPIQLHISRGNHRVVFHRDGYRDIEQTHEFTNIKVKMKLNWKRKP